MRSKKIKILIYVILGIAVLGFSYSYYEARNILLKEYTVTDNDLPQSFDGFRVVFVADIHSNVFFDGKDVGKLVDRINDLNPDIVLLGGDYTIISEKYAVPFFNHLKRIESNYGVYSVFGNHDFWEDNEVLRKGFLEANINLCDNQSYWIVKDTDSIKIGGVGDLWEDVQCLENTTNDLKDNDFSILLSHNPDYIELIDSSPINLMLSGHTHAGQVTFFGLYAPIMPTTLSNHPDISGQKYRYGWEVVNDTKVYVTSGVGVGTFPFRFFAPPEIVLVTLKK